PKMSFINFSKSCAMSVRGRAIEVPRGSWDNRGAGKIGEYADRVVRRLLAALCPTALAPADANPSCDRLRARDCHARSRPRGEPVAPSRRPDRRLFIRV